MQVRVSRVTRGGKTYEYAQLVESYRRPSDGTPMHRVLASLNGLSAVQIANLKTAIAANRQGQRVVVATSSRRARAATPLPKILANLQYLDVAVLLELWKEWGLPEILEEVMPTGGEELSPASVVAALAIQRCVAPGSKLFATQWLPRSALPELLEIAPASFNNTRLHRVLDELDNAGPALMARLPRRYQKQDGAFAALFLDVTDTWFFGGGPSLAQRGKTKEGLVQKKIGIVLLCNEHGYPVRWDVVQGTAHDSKTMSAMVEQIAKLAWVGEATLVVDRAMGKTAQIRTLAASGLRFLTALTTTEFAAYSNRIPSFEASLGSSPDEEQAAQAALHAGMQKAEENLYVLDMGTTERAAEDDRPHAPGSSPQQAIRLARQIAEWVASGEQPSLAAAGRTLGISKALASRYCGLCNLDESIQREVLAGQADGNTLTELLRLAQLPVEEQRASFQAIPAAEAARRSNADGAVQRPKSEGFTVRVLAYFNPQRFVDQRERARKHLAEVDDFVAELNASLAAPRSRHTRSSIAASVDRYLRSCDLLEAFAVTVAEEQREARTRFRVSLRIDEAEWARRRRFDGFTVLVAHPALEGTAADLCRLYRAKDAVEKDFQAIKSVVELRPVHHRADGKVRAHVTLCMLALLLERTLHRRLEGNHSAEAALEMLAPCHLNRLSVAGQAIYSLTESSPDQRALLRRLGLDALLNADAVERLSPR